MGTIADLRQVKQLLNIPDTVTGQDAKLNRHIAEADNYVNNQLSVFNVGIPVANPDANLVSLASSYAAAIATYWNSQSKSPDLLAAMTYYKKQIADHIQAVYGKRNTDGLGESRWALVGSGITGTEPGTAISGGFANEDVDL